MATEPAAAIQTLKRFLDRKRPRPTPDACELCRVEIPPAHGHAVDTDTRKLLCVCRACHLLFTSQGAAGGRYRSIPDRVVSSSEPLMTEAQWNALRIPVGIAFFFYNSRLQRPVAFYPSPAGAIESELPLDVWAEIAATSPLIRDYRPDVEAVLVVEGERLESAIVPIDMCYELVGRLRRTWRGFDGGDDVRRELAAFFDEIRTRSRAACRENGEAQ